VPEVDLRAVPDDLAAMLRFDVSHGYRSSNSRNTARMRAGRSCLSPYHAATVQRLLSPNNLKADQPVDAVALSMALAKEACWLENEVGGFERTVNLLRAAAAVLTAHGEMRVETPST
jgi:hypothetical protein